jgi:putative aldouronate transport system permease protein
MVGFGKRSAADAAFEAVNALFLLIVFAVTLYPLVYVFSCSVSDPIHVLNREVLLFPKGFNFHAYTYLFKYGDILKYYRNTVFYTVAGTLISTVLTVCGAYVLANHTFSGRNVIMFFITFTMYFSGGLIPLFLLVNKLKLYNTVWAILLPSAIAPMNIIIARTFFKGIPFALSESARLDGANDLLILWRIVIPLSGPIIAVLTLYYAVARWNSYFDAMIFLPNADLRPLQLYLVQLLIQNSSQTNAMLNTPYININSLTSMQLKYSAIIVTILPIICIYPFLQRFFIKGVMIGAIKD